MKKLSGGRSKISRFALFGLLTASLAGCGTLESQLSAATPYGQEVQAVDANPGQTQAAPQETGSRSPTRSLETATDGKPLRRKMAQSVKSKGQTDTAGSRGLVTESDKMPTWMSKTTPLVGSAEWKREQEESERREEQIKRSIRGICNGC